MSWWKLEGRAAFHGKVLIAKNEAVGAWARMGAWAADALTDGFVPTEIALAIAERQEVLDRLVSARMRPGGGGLLEAVEGGYRLHDFGDYNPAADTERVRRDELSTRRRHAGKLGAEARWGGKRMANAMANASQKHASDPDPDPDPRSDPDLGSLIRDPETETPRQQEGGSGGGSPSSPQSELFRVSESKRKTPAQRGPSAVSLTSRACEIRDAILSEPDIGPICKRVDELAADLDRVAPGIDAVAKVQALGAWLRQNPTRRKSNGNRWLLNRFTASQDELGSRPAPAPVRTGPRAQVDDWARPQDSDNWPEAKLVPDLIPMPPPPPLGDPPPIPEHLKNLSAAEIERRINEAPGFHGWEPRR